VSLKNYIFVLLLPVLFIFLTRCANPVAPQGGPKDIFPPKIVECEPPALATHFQSRKIRITFNEFIQLKDARNQVTISPPTLPKTAFSIHGKSLIVKLEDSLKANTTYSIYFGEAISDLTENNILHNFDYVFTTGAYIDSLTLQGKVMDAFTLAPQKDVYAMLYINENDTIPFDSLPYKVKPYYLAKSNENGEFHFRNLRNTSFKLFALKDMNGDFIYNMPTEKIAFLDSLANGIYIPPERKDTTIKKDTVLEKPKSPVSDTIRKMDSTGHLPFKIPTYSLRLFEQPDSTQKLLRSELVQEGEVRLVFKFPTRSPEFIPLNFTPQGKWEMEEHSRKKDTVLLWLTNVTTDSLVIKISDAGKKSDTATIDLKRTGKKKSQVKKEKEKPPVLKLTPNIYGNYLNQYGSDFEITFSYPVAHYNLSKIKMYSGKDTLKPGITFPDSLRRIIRIKEKWKEDQSYKVVIPDSAFFALNGLTNDSLIAEFKTRADKDFGTFTIVVTTDIKPGNYIIQLLDEKERVLEERTVSKTAKIRFDHLFPGKYKLKAILDKNRNGTWDTGVYLKNIQPEEVFYFPKTIEVRGNWDIDETWPL
jgi:hypothetical protein